MMHSDSSQYPLYYPPYISGFEEVKISIMTPTNTMETEQLIKARYAFAMSSFGRMFRPPGITKAMMEMCQEWAEDLETPTPMHENLDGVDKYFLDMWKARCYNKGVN